MTDQSFDALLPAAMAAKGGLVYWFVYLRGRAETEVGT